MSEHGGERELGHDGWLFLHPRSVPDKWRSRAVSVAFIPLLPHEARDFLEIDDATPMIPREDHPLVNLLAGGASARQIARRLEIAERTVHRRVARLRAAFEVESTAELVARLSHRGFG